MTKPTDTPARDPSSARSWEPRGDARRAGASVADETRVDYYGLPVIHRPHWKWLIVAYFFLGGIASGSYVVASLADHLCDAISGALEAAGLGADRVAAVSLNLSGDKAALTEENGCRWLAGLDLPDSAAIAVEGDGLSAWAAGGFPDPAIWLLLGTHWGSEGMRDGQKVEHPLDRLDLDARNGALAEGANMGTWALSAAVHAAFGGRPTALYQAFLDALEVRDVHGLIAWARTHTTHDDRAKLFRVAAAAAEAGDEVASELFRGAGTVLGEATVVMGRYMGLSDRPVTVLLAGKAWRAGERLMGPFRQATLAGLPKAEIRENELSQSRGAVLLAMRAAGLQPGPDVMARLGAAPR